MKLTGTVYGHNEAELERNAEAAAERLFPGKDVDVTIAVATIEDITMTQGGTIDVVTFAAEFEAEAR